MLKRTLATSHTIIARILPSLPGRQLAFWLAQFIEARASTTVVPRSAVTAHGGCCQQSALLSDGDIEKLFCLMHEITAVDKALTLAIVTLCT